jgi:hypothetical protein
MTVSRWVILRTRNVLDKSCRENQTHILCSITFFFRKSLRLWDNVKKCGARGATNDVTIWRKRVTCWINKATCTHAHTHARPSTHTNMQYLLLFHSNNDSWTRLDVTLYVHCLSCYFLRIIVKLCAWQIWAVRYRRLEIRNGGNSIQQRNANRCKISTCSTPLTLFCYVSGQ